MFFPMYELGKCFWYSKLRMSFPPNFPFFFFWSLRLCLYFKIHRCRWFYNHLYLISSYMYRNPLPNHLHESQDILKPLPKLNMSSSTLDFRYTYINYWPFDLILSGQQLTALSYESGPMPWLEDTFVFMDLSHHFFISC